MKELKRELQVARTMYVRPTVDVVFEGRRGVDSRR